MARINVELNLWADHRFEYLCELEGNKFIALGKLVHAFKLAQNYWIRDKQLIPKKIWKFSGIGQNLLIAELAIEKENGVYVCGSEEQFDWLLKCSNAGKKSAEIRKNNKLSLTPLEQPSNPLATTLVPPTPTPTPTPAPNTKTPAAKETAANFNFDTIWNKYPKKLGKKEAIRHFNKSVKTEIDYLNIEKALQNFIDHHAYKKTDNKFIPHGGTWFNNWEDWIDVVNPLDQKEIAEQKLYDFLTEAK